jgi:hypothetical protein
MKEAVRQGESVMVIAPEVLLEPGRWAEATFGSVQLGDPRRTRRAVAIAEAVASEQDASLPKQLHDAAALEATYRFLHSGAVSYDELLRPHLHHTREQMGQAGRVLLIQDTTEVDDQQHPTTSGLGPIGNGSHHGFLLQSVLAAYPGRPGGRASCFSPSSIKLVINSQPICRDAPCGHPGAWGAGLKRRASLACGG